MTAVWIDGDRGAATRPMPRERAQAIASAFLPERPLGNRYDFYYTRAKLGTDPLYPGVCDALRGTRAPLLDLGCGLGLLAHALRADGQAMPYHGVDNDTGKIARAGKAARRCGLADVAFDTVDLATTVPTHEGSVAVLDVLQFIPDAAQAKAVDAAVAMLTPGARLVIRTGLADGSRRAHVTRWADVFARAVGWMNALPLHYPEADMLRSRFDAAGLRSDFTPLHGNTPFNNWRIVAWRD